jgi:hypothetical protein
MQKCKDLVNQKFGRLTVIRRADNDKWGTARWLCQCECGNKKVIYGRNLRKGKTRSCGCLLSEKSSERMVKIATKHGNSKSPLYRVYHSMLRRCTNSSDASFKNYGGRGITVCDAWSKDFMNFYSWATSNGYKHGLEIDRIDNDGSYSPSNCQWVTSFSNCQNTRKCKAVIMHDVETNQILSFPTINSASRYSNVSASTISRMIEGIKTKENRFLFSQQI